ncbi:hypothetical protein PR048_028564 [Dryococelus australis]|uniref:Uncharacterized protein n=1 Tax=Dryococelus australis TaxID=614101 RepID=A0ABQ9GAX6_9NEOP|nr:hypothetical protein PR048_028564 [Dryococelus australis]
MWSGAGVKGRGNGRSPRKPANQRHRPARFTLEKIRSPGRGLNPVRHEWEVRSAAVVRLLTSHTGEPVIVPDAAAGRRGFLGDLPSFIPALTHITIIGSQDLDAKRSPNVPLHSTSLACCHALKCLDKASMALIWFHSGCCTISWRLRNTRTGILSQLSDQSLEASHYKRRSVVLDESYHLWNEVRMEQHRHVRAGRKGRYPRKPADPAGSSGTIPTCENPGVIRPDIEPLELPSHAEMKPSRCSWVATRRLPTQHSASGDCIIMLGDATGRRVFLGELPFPQPLHSSTAPYLPHLTLIDLDCPVEPNDLRMKRMSGSPGEHRPPLMMATSTCGPMSEEIWAARDSEVLRAEEGVEVDMGRRSNERVAETGDPRENSLTNGIVRNDSHAQIRYVSAWNYTHVYSKDLGDWFIGYCCTHILPQSLQRRTASLFAARILTCSAQASYSTVSDPHHIQIHVPHYVRFHHSLTVNKAASSLLSNSSESSQHSYSPQPTDKTKCRLAQAMCRRTGWRDLGEPARLFSQLPSQGRYRGRAGLCISLQDDSRRGPPGRGPASTSVTAITEEACTSAAMRIARCNLAAEHNNWNEEEKCKRLKYYVKGSAKHTLDNYQQTHVGEISRHGIEKKLKTTFSTPATEEYLKQLLITTKQKLNESAQKHIETLMFYSHKYNPNIRDTDFIGIVWRSLLPSIADKMAGLKNGTIEDMVTNIQRAELVLFRAHRRKEQPPRNDSSTQHFQLRNKQAGSSKNKHEIHDHPRGETRRESQAKRPVPPDVKVSCIIDACQALFNKRVPTCSYGLRRPTFGNVIHVHAEFMHKSSRRQLPIVTQ